MRQRTRARSSTPASRRTRSSRPPPPPQRVLARAVMNGETTAPESWRTMFPTLFGSTGPAEGSPERDRSEAVLAASLAVAGRGEQVRSQFRGAIVEAVTELLLH